jgi:hypothetical protein
VFLIVNPIENPQKDETLDNFNIVKNLRFVDPLLRLRGLLFRLDFDLTWSNS